MKTLGVKFLLVSVLVGLVLPALYLPNVIVWYGEPIVPNGISCGPTVAWSIHRYIVAQFASGAVFLVLALLIRWKWNQRKS